jgi:hypothetical protein
MPCSRQSFPFTNALNCPEFVESLDVSRNLISSIPPDVVRSMHRMVHLNISANRLVSLPLQVMGVDFFAVTAVLNANTVVACESLM